MKKTLKSNYSARIFALLVAILMLLSALTSCVGGNGNDTTADPNTGSDSTTAPLIPDGYTFELSADYTVIRSADAGDICKTASIALKDKLCELTGKQVKIKDDWIKNTADIPADADSLEILVGVTNRPSSVSALEALGGEMKYSITIVGRRILITAESEALVSYAVDYFLNDLLFVDNAGGRLLLPAELSYVSGVFSTLTIASGGVSQYGIVYSQNAADIVKNEYIKLKDGINAILGNNSQTIKNDALSKAGSYDPNKKEILVGVTGHDENPTGRAEFGYNECGFSVVGNKIILTGRTLESTFYAAETFLDMLRGAAKLGADGKTEIVIPYLDTVKWEYSEYCADIPEYIGTLTEAYDCGDGAVTMLYADAAETDYTAYLAAAEAMGYSTVSSYTAGTENYVTLECDNTVTRLYVSYGNEGMRITTEPKSLPTFPTEVESDPYRTGITFTQMALNYASTAGNTNGMSYVLQLSDGSYVIWDGGFTADSPELYDFLKKNAPNGSVPHIRMWVFTHLHGDHFGCFLEFADTFGGSVKLDYLGINMPSIYSDPEGDSIYFNGKLSTALSKFVGVKKVKLHTGTCLKLPGADIEVLLTHEDLGINNIYSQYRNDQSMVTRIITTSDKLMLPGDAQTVAGDYIVGRFGSYLESNYVQVAHHGSINHPTTLEFYKTVKPSYVFFPGSQSRFNENKKTQQNAYLLNIVSMKNFFVADIQDKTVELD